MEACLQVTRHRRKPSQPSRSEGYNANAEPDDRKRKADASNLTVSTPSVPSIAEDDDEDTDDDDDVTMTQQHQQAAPDNQDRQNPEGSGGNPV